MHHYFKVLKKYAVFSGRAQRVEYWYFILFYLLGYIVAYIIFGTIFIFTQVSMTSLVWTNWIYVLVFFLPGLAVSVRRLHDIGRSGLWLLLNFIPFGSIILLIFLVQDSQFGENKYGFNPKDTPTITDF